MRTSNPALKENTFIRERALPGAPAMTLEGTATKSLMLILLAIFSAAFTWRAYFAGHVQVMMPAMLIGGLGALVVALVAVFRPRTSPITGPLYAVLEGLALGAISAFYESRYGGIVMQAVGLTFMVFLALLLAYRSRLVQATENFRLGIVAATGGIMLYYLLSMVLGFFGIQAPLIHSTGTFGILFSLAVVVVAALNLVLDFDFIERGVEHGAPKYMEWYAAFGLLVTLVWLYLELLRLLAKLQGRRR